MTAPLTSEHSERACPRCARPYLVHAPPLRSVPHVCIKCWTVGDGDFGLIAQCVLCGAMFFKDRRSGRLACTTEHHRIYRARCSAEQVLAEDLADLRARITDLETRVAYAKTFEAANAYLCECGLDSPELTPAFRLHIAVEDLSLLREQVLALMEETAALKAREGLPSVAGTGTANPPRSEEEANQ